MTEGLAQHIRLHRFGDRLALYAGNGETVYLDFKQVEQLARAVNRAKRDIERTPFTASTYPSILIETADPNRPAVKLARV